MDHLIDSILRKNYDEKRLQSSSAARRKLHNTPHRDSHSTISTAPGIFSQATLRNSDRTLRRSRLPSLIAFTLEGFSSELDLSDDNLQDEPVMPSSSGKKSRFSDIVFTPKPTDCRISMKELIDYEISRISAPGDSNSRKSVQPTSEEEDPIDVGSSIPNQHTRQVCTNKHILDLSPGKPVSSHKHIVHLTPQEPGRAVKSHQHILSLMPQDDDDEEEEEEKEEVPHKIVKPHHQHILTLGLKTERLSSCVSKDTATTSLALSLMSSASYFLKSNQKRLVHADSKRTTIQ